MLVVSSCHNSEKPMLSFYYWKTVFNLSETEKTILSENKVSKLYIRYFDIDLDPKTKKPIPNAPIIFTIEPTNFIVTPVIYIKNQVMLNPNLDIKDLAQKTYNYIQQINSKNHISCQEIQIDCDWTLSSKSNYLAFIDAFKKISGKKLSATIRLHQIKYFKETKIPNVDKGVLMYYNMGEIASNSQNSIYEQKIASKYLSSLKKYPLPLDIALPIYSWGIHIRQNRVLGLLNKIDVASFQKDTNFVTTKNNFYKARNNVFKNGTFFKKNDELKLEFVSENKLLEMTTDLKQNLKQNPDEIIIYDLDQFNLKKYEKNIFTQVINRF